MPIGWERIRELFGYHRPLINGDNDTTNQHIALRRQFRDFARFLDEVLPDGREKSLAFTKLEEASMWSHKAVALQDPVDGEGEEFQDLSETRRQAIQKLQEGQTQFLQDVVEKREELTEVDKALRERNRTYLDELRDKAKRRLQEGGEENKETYVFGSPVADETPREQADRVLEYYRELRGRGEDLPYVEGAPATTDREIDQIRVGIEKDPGELRLPDLRPREPFPETEEIMNDVTQILGEVDDPPLVPNRQKQEDRRDKNDIPKQRSRRDNPGEESIEPQHPFDH